MVVYLFILISLLILSYFKYNEFVHSLYLALTLIPLIRIISVSLPLQGLPSVLGLVLVSVPLFIAGAMVARMVGLTHTELGFRFRRLHYQFLIALLGLPLGFIESLIAKPIIINTQATSQEILIAVSVLILCVGLLEEFIFRGILFNVALEVLGDKKAVFLTSLLYATLTISGQSILNVIYAFMISLLFCRIVAWQKSIIGVSLAHGLINVLPYLIYLYFN